MSEYPAVTRDQINVLRTALSHSNHAYWQAIRATPSIPPAQVPTIERLLAEQLIGMSPGEAESFLLSRCDVGESPVERMDSLISDLRHATAQNLA